MITETVALKALLSGAVSAAGERGLGASTFRSRRFARGLSGASGAASGLGKGDDGSYTGSLHSGCFSPLT